MLFGRESEWLLWRGPVGWKYVRETGPILSWREGSSSTARTRPTARTCSKSRARPHHPRRWSRYGPRKFRTTTTNRTDVAACVGTTLKSFGVTQKKSDAQWREEEDARFGFATTIRPATGSASGPISRPRPLMSGARATFGRPGCSRISNAGGRIQSSKPAGLPRVTRNRSVSRVKSEKGYPSSRSTDGWGCSSRKGI
jgi:hypothetical protein